MRESCMRGKLSDRCAMTLSLSGAPLNILVHDELYRMLFKFYREACENNKVPGKKFPRSGKEQRQKCPMEQNSIENQLYTNRFSEESASSESEASLGENQAERRDAKTTWS
eukprot:TRINITY_DN11513_c0_g1_i1.p1 TRINITY_DN11513_c0_g1~~TRINITY_DN11513_c0_g1_i1.p1  ORF type:complete len:111 (+),score=2.47 TRINITY_DN11513_c0_g1_i1:337-669(+)